MPHTYPVLDLAGSPYAMGHAHGDALASRIVALLESITGVHRTNNSFLKAEPSQLRAMCQRNLGFLEEWCPELVEEMRGIADGAGVAFEDILYLNCFLELEDLRAPGLGGTALPQSLWGCTTFNVLPHASADSRAYIGQTYDMERIYQEYFCLLRMRPDTGPAMLVGTFAGMVGINGMNSAGVGAVINKIVAKDARPGVIYPCVMRKALGSERIGDALGAVIYSPRATGLNYQLTGEGVAFCVETSATSYELLEFEDAIAHTNHYVSQHMRRYETANWLSHGGTMVRRQVAERFLKQHQGVLTPDLLKELTCNHTNYPRCICAHGFPGEGDDTAFHTVVAMVMDPAAGWMDVCVGNPCQGEYVRHTL